MPFASYGTMLCASGGTPTHQASSPRTLPTHRHKWCVGSVGSKIIF